MFQKNNLYGQLIHNLYNFLFQKLIKYSNVAIITTNLFRKELQIIILYYYN